MYYRDCLASVTVDHHPPRVLLDLPVRIGRSLANSLAEIRFVVRNVVYVDSVATGRKKENSAQTL